MDDTLNSVSETVTAVDGRAVKRTSLLARFRRFWTSVFGDWGQPSADGSKPYALILFERFTYRVFRLSGELTAIALGITFFWVCAINIVLARKTVDVSFLEPNAALWFSNAFDGKNAEVGAMTVNWHARENTISFNTENVTVSGDDGATIQTIAALTTELALRDVVAARLEPLRIEIDGGQVTVQKMDDGRLEFGLGTPDNAAFFGPLQRGGLKADAAQVDVSGRDYVGRLRSVRLQNADVFWVDAAQDYQLMVQKAALDLDIKDGLIRFDGKGTLDKDGQTSPLAASGALTPDLSDIDALVLLDGVNPAQVLPLNSPANALRALNAPLSISAQIKASGETGLSSLLVDASAGAGTWRSAGGLAPFQSAQIKGAYDPNTQTMRLPDIALQSGPISFRGAATISGIGDPQFGFFKTPITTSVNLVDVNIGPRDDMPDGLTVNDIEFEGVIIPKARRLEFNTLSADFGGFQAVLSGELERKTDGRLSSVKLSGGIEGEVSRADVLRIWPNNRIMGARNWVEASVIDATLSNIVITIDADVDALAAPSLPNDALNVTFDVSKGAVRYIKTMTAVTGASGSGVLEGNRAQMDLYAGQIGAITLTGGSVEMPRIYPYGGDMIINADGEGDLPDLLALIDQKPFEYVSRYGVDAADFAGQGTIKLSLTRPLRERIKYSDITYEVTGALSDVSAPFSVGRHSLTQGNVTLRAASDGLSVKGPVQIGPWQADMAWTEIFDDGATPTRYSVQGVVDRSDLDALGLGFRQYLSGDIFLSVDAIADGLQIISADVKADLTQTDLRLGPYWSKSAGVSGTINGTLSMTKAGGFSLSDMTVRAPGFNVAGSLDMGEGFRLNQLDLAQAKIAGFVDAAIQMKPDNKGEKFDLLVTGDYLDVSPFVTGLMSRSDGAALDVPLLMTASLKQLALNEAYVLRNANMLFAHDGTGVRQARLKGDTADGAFLIDLVTDDLAASRALDVDIPNASNAAFAFLGLDSLTGGRAQLSARLPYAGQNGVIVGKTTIEDVKLVNAPIMTRILSLASLQGLADALSGGGLGFQTLEVPFSLDGATLSVRDGRAAGPALGMTGEGEIDFSAKTVDFDGVLVPAYTANSILGDIPLIGDIFVGKKGEGIFALSYTVLGPFAQSQVAVNPLSALTPGFLRGIFKPQRDALPESVVDATKEVTPEAEE